MRKLGPLVTVVIVGCGSSKPATPPAPPVTRAPPAPIAAPAAPSAQPPAIAAPAAEILAKDQGAPTEMVVTATDIYWIDEGSNSEPNGGIVKLSKAGGKPVRIADKQITPIALAVDATTMYFTDLGSFDSIKAPPRGTVMAVPIAGGKVRTIASPPGRPRGIAIDDTHVYFTLQVREGDTTTVSRVAKKGGAIEVVAKKQRSPNGVATLGGAVYWAQGGSCVSENGAPIPDDGSIVTASVRGAAVRTLVDHLRCPEPIVFDTTDVYFTSFSETISAVPMAGGAARTVLADASGVRWIAISGEYIYFAKQGTGEIGKVSKRGGAPVTLASTKDPGGIAVDDTYVYFTDSHAGTVSRVAK